MNKSNDYNKFAMEGRTKSLIDKGFALKKSNDKDYEISLRN